MTVVHISNPRMSWTCLPSDAAAMLWAMRHLVVCWPSCHSVRAALLDRYGDDATGIEHLLRGLIAGIAMHGRRRLSIGTPVCAVLLPDEVELLEAIGVDGAAPDASALTRLCASPKGERLAPLANALSEAVARARCRRLQADVAQRRTLNSFSKRFDRPISVP